MHPVAPGAVGHDGLARVEGLDHLAAGTFRLGGLRRRVGAGDPSSR